MECEGDKVACGVLNIIIVIKKRQNNMPIQTNGDRNRHVGESQKYPHPYRKQMVIPQEDGGMT